jgi:hypothetical protein
MYPQNQNVQNPFQSQRPNPYANGLPNVLPAGGSIVGTHLPAAVPVQHAMPGGEAGFNSHDYRTQRMLRQLTGGSHATSFHGNSKQQQALNAAMHASGIHGHAAKELQRTLRAMGRGDFGMGGGAATGMPSHMPSVAPHHVAPPVNISMTRPHF